eukprot:1355800-Amorphochlora_amoeboformis.AAC.1
MDENREKERERKRERGRKKEGKRERKREIERKDMICREPVRARPRARHVSIGRPLRRCRHK